MFSVSTRFEMPKRIQGDSAGMPNSAVRGLLGDDALGPLLAVKGLGKKAKERTPITLPKQKHSSRNPSKVRSTTCDSVALLLHPEFPGRVFEAT